MSLHRLVVVSCDHCGANVDFDAWAHTAEQTRKNWQGSGWLLGLPGGRDVCAACVAAQLE